MRRLLRKFGFYKVTWGSSAEMSWVQIDQDVLIAQTANPDYFFMTEDEVVRLQRRIRT